MTQQTVETIYQHTLLADAAYLDWSKPVSVSDLTVNDDGRRFNPTQAKNFLDRYQVIEHKEKTASGFQATLFLDTDTNKQILAIRGFTTKHFFPISHMS